MPFDIHSARQSGYSDSEIGEFLAKNHPEFNVPAAVKSGYSLDEIAQELNNPSKGAGEDPGMLKSAAAGFMSGVPLAETATAGLSSLVHGTPYAQEHKNLEDLKDKAWDQHPWMYGAGKTAGIVGTGATLPASIPAAIGVGAAAGVDETSNMNALPGNVMKGGAMGAALGTIGEKVISPAISAIPGLAKKGLAAIMPVPGNRGIESIEGLLKDPEALAKAVGPQKAAEVLADRTNDLKIAAGHLGSDARGLLSPDVTPISTEIPEAVGSIKTIKGASGPETPPSSTNVFGQPIESTQAPTSSLNNPGDVVVTTGSKVNLASPGMTTIDNLTPIFDRLKGQLSLNGVATSPNNEAALRALDSQYQRLVQIAQANGGKLSETDLKQIIVGLQDMLNKNVFDNPDVSATKGALAKLSGELNGVLKQNTPYAEAMKPVADLTGQVADTAKTFKLDNSSAEGFSPSDTTNSKMSGILNENKTNAQDVLQKIGDLTGFDFLKNAKDYELAQGFDSGVRGGHGLQAVGGGLGAVAGRLLGLPGGALGGAAAGGLLANSLDGGQIAKSVLTKWMSIDKAMVDSGTKAVLQKYGPILANAAKQGGNQLAATHFVLATSHPEYQELINKISEENH